MTVKEYLDKRGKELYKKKIRVIDVNSHGGFKDWTLFMDRKILKISVTTTILFIYV